MFCGGRFYGLFYDLFTEEDEKICGVRSKASRLSITESVVWKVRKWVLNEKVSIKCTIIARSRLQPAGRYCFGSRHKNVGLPPAVLSVPYVKWSDLLQKRQKNVPRQFLYFSSTSLTLKGQRSRSNIRKCRSRSFFSDNSATYCLIYFYTVLKKHVTTLLMISWIRTVHLQKNFWHTYY